eukprot:463302-Hanusia_phi.AAC.7
MHLIQFLVGVNLQYPSLPVGTPSTCQSSRQSCPLTHSSSSHVVVLPRPPVHGHPGGSVMSDLLLGDLLRAVRPVARKRVEHRGVGDVAAPGVVTGPPSAVNSVEGEELVGKSADPKCYSGN